MSTPPMICPEKGGAGVQSCSIGGQHSPCGLESSAMCDIDNDKNNKTQQPTHVNNVLEYDEGSSHKHLTSKSNSSNEQKENTNDDIEKKKNVRFTPTNKIRQFSNLDTVSTLLQADERSVELQNNAGKGPMRRPKRTKIPTTGIYKSLMKSEPESISNDASFAIISLK